MMSSGSAAINARRRRSLAVTGLGAMRGSPGCGVLETKSPGPCWTGANGLPFSRHVTDLANRAKSSGKSGATKSPGLATGAANHTIQAIDGLGRLFADPTYALPDPDPVLGHLPFV